MQTEEPMEPSPESHRSCDGCQHLEQPLTPSPFTCQRQRVDHQLGQAICQQPGQASAQGGLVSPDHQGLRQRLQTRFIGGDVKFVAYCGKKRHDMLQTWNGKNSFIKVV